MPNVNAFLICENITNGDASRPIPTIEGPATMLRPMFIPCTHSFAFLIGIADLDLKTQHKVNMIITSPDNEVVQKVEYNTNTEVSENPVDTMIPNEYKGYIFMTNIRNMVIKKEGRYVLNVSVDDNEIDEMVIPVYKKSEV